MIDDKTKVNRSIKTILKDKKINSISDLFKLIRCLMEFVERFKSLTGEEKNNLIYDNVIDLLFRNYTIGEASQYIVMINPYIENLIILSKSKILLNLKKKNFLKDCFKKKTGFKKYIHFVIKMILFRSIKGIYIR
jgi:hypothetical protein